MGWWRPPSWVLFLAARRRGVGDAGPDAMRAIGRSSGSRHRRGCLACRSGRVPLRTADDRRRFAQTACSALGSLARTRSSWLCELMSSWRTPCAGDGSTVRGLMNSWLPISGWERGLSGSRATTGPTAGLPTRRRRGDAGSTAMDPEAPRRSWGPCTSDTGRTSRPRARAVVAHVALPAFRDASRLGRQRIFRRVVRPHLGESDPALGEKHGRRLALREARPALPEHVAQALGVGVDRPALEIGVVVMRPCLLGPRPIADHVQRVEERAENSRCGVTLRPTISLSAVDGARSSVVSPWRHATA